MEGRRAPRTSTLRYAEHAVLSGCTGRDHYLDQWQKLRAENPVIINSHCMDMPGQETMCKVRAVWSTDAMSWQWICRDIMLNDWQHDVMPYINTDTKAWLSDRGYSARHRLLRFLQHQHKHGHWKANEVLPDGWTGFCLDRIFSMDFVDDLVALSALLDLAMDTDLAVSSHAQWLAKNQPRDFTPRTAVRYLEARQVLELL
jgi:hypothetical protein